jgi:chromosome segregation ATPase
MTESRDCYKKDYENLKAEKEKIETKYREALSNNLALEKKLTETNEEYLQIAKKSEQLEDKIKHVNRITKVTTKF